MKGGPIQESRKMAPLTVGRVADHYELAETRQNKMPHRCNEESIVYSNGRPKKRTVCKE